MRWDEQGRLWVLSIPTYPQLLPDQLPDDKLLILEDKNKDGKADTATVFARGLNIPLGFELGHGGVYLGEQTRLLFLKDTNRDNRCDVTQTLLSGFGTHDLHQTINSFTWSPGGELYFAQGLSIHSRVETPWGIKKADRRGIWRYRPMAQQLDAVLDESTASDNPWGMTFGDWGDLFSKSNDTGVYFTNPALILSDRKVLVPEIGATVIKSGIVEQPRSHHLPDDMQHDFLIAGYYNNTVERMTVVDDGAGFKARLVAPLLTSISKNFRPVDIKTGPDGAIYVLDWYNPIIGHYQASLRDPMRDKTHGRVWRITARNRPLIKQPNLTTQTVPELLDHLKSNEYWLRYQVRRLLAAKPWVDVEPSLHGFLKKLNVAAPDYEHHLMEALAVFESHEIVDTTLLKQLLHAKKTGARGYAAQVTGRWSQRITDPLRLLAPLFDDSHPRVRLHALVAAAAVQTSEAMVWSARVLNHPMDKFLAHALEKAVFSLRPFWEPALQASHLRFQNNRQLATIIALTIPDWYRPAMYKTLLEARGVDAVVKSRLLFGLAKSGDSHNLNYVLHLPFTQQNAGLLEALSQKKVSQLPSSIVHAIQKIIISPAGDRVKTAGLKLARVWSLKPLLPTLYTLIKDKRISDAVRSNALTALAELDGQNAIPTLQQFTDGRYPRTIRTAAINSLCKLDVGIAAIAIVNEMQDTNKDLNIMRDVISTILYEPDGIEALTREIGKQGLSPAQAHLALTVLEQRTIHGPELYGVLKKFVPRTMAGPPTDFDTDYVESIAALTTGQGNARAGAVLYQNKLSCGSCHRIGEKGGNMGPNLSAVGSGLSVKDITTEILWPNKNIKEGYFSIQIETINGETIQGIKVLETADALSIKTTPASQPVTYPRNQIARVTNIGSAMPAGLANQLSAQELANVVRYLSELKNK
jgi:putative heme-binding domain-containing protein